MNYLTNYYKNLSEQLQEKVNHLQKLLEASQNDERNYDVQSRGWEIQDISPEARERVANRYAKEIGYNDVDFANQQSAYTSGREVMPRTSYQNVKYGEVPASKFAQYNTQQDAPIPGMSPAMQALRNREINLLNAKNLAKAEVKSMRGNMDYLAPAMLKADKEDNVQRDPNAWYGRGGDAESRIMTRMAQAEKDVRRENEPVTTGEDAEGEYSLVRKSKEQAMRAIKK